MRTLSATLQTAQAAASRGPLARTTVRNMRLRFTQFTQQTNPWAITNDAYQVLVSGQTTASNYVFGDSIVLANGAILRVWSSLSGGAQNTLRLNRVTDPTIAAQWGTWTDLVVEVKDGVNPGLVQASGGTVYCFYSRLDTIYYITSADNGATWSSETSTGLTVAGVHTIAPVTETEVYVYTSILTDAETLQVYRLVNSGGWSSSTAPYRIHGTSVEDISTYEFSSITYFDAVRVGEYDVIITSFGQKGQCWITRYRDGIWGDPVLLTAEDDSKFHPYRASVIQNRLWLTGRVVRPGPVGYEQKWDAVYYSDDGEYWTAARDQFLTTVEIRGKLLLSGSYVYYPGIYTVYRAPVTYLIDPAGDPASEKVTLTTDILSGSLNLTGSAAAAAGVLTVSNADEAYMSHAVLAAGSELWREWGYKTSAGNEYVQMSREGIDLVEQVIADGKRGLTLRTRDVAMKALRQWRSLWWWDLTSQLKHYDDCNELDKMAIIAGTWEVSGSSYIKTLSQNTDGVLLSTEPYEGRDVILAARVYIANTVGTSTLDVGFVLGYVDTSNYLLARFRRGSTNNVTFWKRRAGVWTQLGSSGSFTLSNGKYYELLAVWRGNTVRLYAADRGVGNTLPSDYGAALLTYTWADTQVPVPSSNGKGKDGFYTKIAPATATIENMPDWCGEIPVQETDLSAFPASGTVKIDNEIITYSSKTPVHEPARTEIFRNIARAGYFDYSSPPPAGCSSGCGGTSSGFGIAHDNAQNCRGGDGTYFNNYALCTKDGAWWVSKIVGYNGSSKEYRDANGNCQRSSGGIWYTEDDPTGAVSGQFAVRAGLLGCTRGAQSTTAVSHAGNVQVREYTDDEVRLHRFKAYDYAPDRSAETLIKRVAIAAGAPGVSFKNTYSSASIALTASAGVWGSGAWLSGVDLKEFDLSFDLPVLADGQKLAVMFRASAQAWSTFTGFSLVYSRSGSNYDLALYTGAAATLFERYRLWQSPTDTIPVRVVSWGEFTAVWFADALIFTFHDVSYAAQTNNYVGFNAYNANLTLTSVRIPELYERREAVGVDVEMDGVSAIQRVIGQRPIRFFADSSGNLKASLFGTRDSLQAVGSGLHVDVGTPSDLEVASMTRVQAEDIVEYLSATVAGASGFILVPAHMPELSTAQAYKEAQNMITRARELQNQRRIQSGARLDWEPEDKVSISYTASGTGRVVTETIIVNDVNYSLSGGGSVFSMSAGGRREIV